MIFYFAGFVDLPRGQGLSAYLLLASGVLVFLLALRWDAKDLQRVTRKSDVAFWLHLTSVPLVVHPIFDWLLATFVVWPVAQSQAGHFGYFAECHPKQGAVRCVMPAAMFGLFKPN